MQSPQPAQSKVRPSLDLYQLWQLPPAVALAQAVIVHAEQPAGTAMHDCPPPPLDPGGTEPPPLLLPPEGTPASRAGMLGGGGGGGDMQAPPTHI